MEENAPTQKKVDESWKAQARREREEAAARAARQPRQQPQGRPETMAEGARTAGRPAGAAALLQKADFNTLVSNMVAQALISLGELPRPGTNERSVDLEGAKYIIDLLGVLEAKTKGNLTRQEETALRDSLYDLRMLYVRRSQGSSPSA